LNIEVVGTVLASLGGASAIITVFAHFLGKVWADRIAKQTIAKYDQELENVKSNNTRALEEFKRKSESDLKEREHFSGIYIEVYQEFFKQRVATYTKLLELKNHYISEMHEDAITEETESWGDAYYASYKALRKNLIENQLYITTELENKFHKLRMEAAKFTKEADLAEGYAIGSGASSWEADEQRSPVNDKFAKETSSLMSDVLEQIDSDVSKLRSRIDIDRVNADEKQTKKA